MHLLKPVSPFFIIIDIYTYLYLYFSPSFFAPTRLTFLMHVISQYKGIGGHTLPRSLAQQVLLLFSMETSL